MDLAITVVPSVAILAGAGLKGLQMWLASRERKLTHEPLHLMQAKLDELETRLLGQALRR
jgi:hypothetical protein